MKRGDNTVLAFGAFDPLHEGHVHFFRQAKASGSTLVVVVARDSAIQQEKHRDPFEPETVRLKNISQIPEVDSALLGDADPRSYGVLRRVDFDVLALGYDQKPSDEEARELLDSCGKQGARIIRLDPYRPDTYKSSLIRNGALP